MKGKIVITGANGFIGSNLVRTGINLGFEVVALIRKKSNDAQLQGLDVELIRTDYSNYSEMRSQFDQLGKIQSFIHCAGVTESRNNQGFISGNVKVTENILKTIETSKMNVKHFVHLSSLAARGPGLDKHSVGDTPISDYGRSKVQAEQLVKQCNLSWTIIRPTAVYGPGDRAFLELAKLLRYRLAVELGDPKSRLTFIHVQDLCDLIFDSVKWPQQIVYGYDGDIYQQKEVIEAFKSAMGVNRLLKIPISSSFFMKLSSTLNDISLTLLDRTWKYTPEKAKELIATDWSIQQDNETLGIKPRYQLKEGVRHTVDWYRSRKWL